MNVQFDKPQRSHQFISYVLYVAWRVCATKMLTAAGVKKKKKGVTQLKVNQAVEV